MKTVRIFNPLHVLTNKISVYLDKKVYKKRKEETKGGYH